MTAPSSEMRVFSARLATFEIEHHLSKRRASAQSKAKKAGTVEWPHARPAPADLARAGFFYRPAHDSADNVQCFLCTVKLDGWEETDNPVKEHLAHSQSCAWATAISVQRDEEEEIEDPEMRDPLSEEMISARHATFTNEPGWPHEDKKGWKCKISKMLEAGWVLDPVGDKEEDGDGVTCFYCNLSLDGWEPKDDPFVEHKRRSPNCRFFQLLGHYHGEAAAEGKMKKSKAKKAGSRASSVSRTSRMSVQSTLSEAPSMPGAFHDDSLAGVDDSIVTTATNASQATASGKGSKKGGKTKAGGKPAKGRKKDNSEEPQYPDLSQTLAADGTELPSSQVPPIEGTSISKSKATRTASQASRPLDTSVTEVSQAEYEPPNKAARPRKAKAQPQPEHQDEPEQPPLAPETPDVEFVRKKRLSEVSAQLQDELEQSVDNFEPLDESTPVVEQAKPKRGVKRTSDGQRKTLEVESSVLEVEAPAQPKPKAKRGRPKKSSTVATDVELEAQVNPAHVVDEQPQDESTLVPPAKAKKGKGRAKGSKKTSSARTSRSSKATTAATENETQDEPEDLAKDELEIEQELERIAAEQASQQALQAEQEKIDEFEPSPSSGRVSKDSAELQQAQAEAEPSKATSEKDFASPRQSIKSTMPGGFTPSPASSNKENQPSSAFQPSAKQNAPPVMVSPTKTTRVPLAATTPNKSPMKTMLSPSKHISKLSSAMPWTAVDLDTVLLPSPQPEPGKLGQQLVAAAGGLASPEKQMSVEDWVRYRAEKGEEELRKRCEEMVATFERQGMRALESLNGINVVG